MFDDKPFREEIGKIFGPYQNSVGVLNKSYNIPPTQNIAIYTNTKLYTYAHFGLIPSWAKEPSSMQINARSETIYEKNSFKDAYRQRRCLIPLNGYFEWKKDAKSKLSRPYFIRSATGEYFAFAGIYERWYDNKLGKALLTCALLTTEPNEKIAQLHNRMPVIIEPNKWETWLNAKSSYQELNKLFTPLSSSKMDCYPVGDIVNSVKNDTIECIKENIKIEPKQGTLF